MLSRSVAWSRCCTFWRQSPFSQGLPSPKVGGDARNSSGVQAGGHLSYRNFLHPLWMRVLAFIFFRSFVFLAGNQWGLVKVFVPEWPHRKWAIGMATNMPSPCGFLNFCARMTRKQPPVPQNSVETRYSPPVRFCSTCPGRSNLNCPVWRMRRPAYSFFRGPNFLGIPERPRTAMCGPPLPLRLKWSLALGGASSPREFGRAGVS